MFRCVFTLFLFRLGRVLSLELLFLDTCKVVGIEENLVCDASLLKMVHPRSVPRLLSFPTHFPLSEVISPQFSIYLRT